jgi:two-component system response regulator RegX3
MTRVLVVEDEQGLREPLVYMLEKEGYEVIEAADGNLALEAFKNSEPDLILLDLMLPGISGNEVCRVIRQTSNVPVIMLTAKDGEIDKVVGLEIGADDYVTKPYSTRELLARMKAVLRRNSEPSQIEDGVLAGGPVSMDVNRHIVFVHGEKIAMPLKEFELLELLLENRNRVLTRGQTVARPRRNDRAHESKAGRPATSHESGTRRRTHGARPKIGQVYPGRGEAVEIRRGDDFASIEADVGKTEIIGDDDENIGLASLRTRDRHEGDAQQEAREQKAQCAGSEPAPHHTHSAADREEA